jgi:excisionase family DNA binding protein
MAASPLAPIDALADDLEHLDTVAVLATVERLAESGTSLPQLLDGALLPAWERVEERSRIGEIDPAASGAAAAVARRAIAVAAARATGGPSADTHGLLAVVSPAGTADLLRSAAVAESATASGWLVEQLSGSAAPSELAAYSRSHRPVAVVITAHDAADLMSLLPVTAAAHDEGVPVLAWGAAFGASGRRAARLGADGWAPNVASALSILAGWDQDTPELVEPAPLPAAYGELERLRPSLLQAALGAGAEDGSGAEWTRRAAPAFVDQLVAAVVFEEPEILTEHLGREHLGRRDDVDGDVVGLVDAVASALPSTADPARDYVWGAREELRRSLLTGSRPLRSASPGADERAGAGIEAPGTQAGQVFADLLLLAALSCQTQLALLSVPQGHGQWRTLSYGFEVRLGLDDRRLFDLIASRRDPVEIADLAVHPDLCRSPLAGAPHNLRWAYGMALRQGDGPVLGVVVVLDRWLRQASRREQRAILAVARQATAHLAQVRRVPSGPTQLLAPTPLPAPRPDPMSGLVSLRRGGSLPEGQQLLRSHEVAVLFDVTERTVINWAASGKLPSLRTIGGHLRFRREDVLELLDGRSSGLRQTRRSS